MHNAGVDKGLENLHGVIITVVVVNGYLVDPYRVVVRDPLGQEASEVLCSHACGHLSWQWRENVLGYVCGDVSRTTVRIQTEHETHLGAIYVNCCTQKQWHKPNRLLPVHVKQG